MPVTPNSRVETIADAICNLRRNQLDSLAHELLERDADWGRALGLRLTGQVALRVVAQEASDPDFEVKGDLFDGPDGNLVSPEGDEG